MITFYNVKEQLLARAIHIAPVYMGGHKKPWWQFFKMRRYKFIVLKPLEVLLSNGEVINIPDTFETDLSSVPRIFWAIFAPYGDFLLAAIIHDYLYVYNIQDRYFADKEMLKWSSAIWDNMTDNIIRFHMVRTFGESWWRRASERIAREKNI